MATSADMANASTKKSVPACRNASLSLRLMEGTAILQIEFL
jgi:hypothetical protein